MELLQNQFAKIGFEKGTSKLGFIVERVVDNFVFAKLGKKATSLIGAPPEEHFEKKKMDDWLDCSVFINLSDDKNVGQSIAFERKRHIFDDPLIQLKALGEKINLHLKEFGYRIEINPIADKREFWNLYRENKGSIDEFHVKAIAPNLFGGSDEFSEELKKAKELYNMTTLEVSVKNDEKNLTLPEGDNFVTQALDYTAKGGGEAYLKIKGIKRYAHKEYPKQHDFDEIDIDMKGADPDNFKHALNKVFSWLKD